MKLSKVLQYLINLSILKSAARGIGDFLTQEKDFQTFKGFPVEVSYQDLKKIEQQTNGLLLKRTDNELHINQKGKTQRIPVEDVIQVRLTKTAG